MALLEQHPGQVNGPPVPYVGISLVALNDNVRAQIGYKGEGVGIEGVYDGSPADTAGLQPGDVIQKVGNENVSSPDEVQKAIAAEKPGTTIRLQVWRGGFKQFAMVTVGTAPPDFPVK